MKINRRTFLRGAAAGALTLFGPSLPHALGATGELTYFSACQLADGRYAIVAFSPDGTILRTWPLPDRGHGFAVSPDRSRLVAFARHPRTFAVAFDALGETEPVLFAAPEGRHFYGHGVYAAEGRLLLATENDYDGGRGVVGIYDVGADYQRIGEYDSNGVGPHEVVMLPDGRTVAIANGGLETHPLAGDAVLNLATMSPSLVFLDSVSGDVLAEHKLDPSLHQLSIRHLAVGADSSVWFGCQYQGPESDRPPLVGRASVDAGPLMVNEPDDLRTDLRNYIGSVAASADGSVISVASPVGNRIVFMNLAGDVVGWDRLDDGCGLAHTEGGGFVATSGGGEIIDVAPGSERRDVAMLDLAFDNHIAIARR